MKYSTLQFLDNYSQEVVISRVLMKNSLAPSPGQVGALPCLSNPGGGSRAPCLKRSEWGLCYAKAISRLGQPLIPLQIAQVASEIECVCAISSHTMY